MSPFCSIDGPPEEKPRKLNSGNEAQDGNKNYSEPILIDSPDVKPTPPSQKKKSLQMKKDEKHLITSPSLERLKIKVVIKNNNK